MASRPGRSKRRPLGRVEELGLGQTVLELLPRYVAAAPVAASTLTLYRQRIEQFAGWLEEKRPPS